MEKITQQKTYNHGHTFKKKTFHKPTFCQACSAMLWGITNQGLSCTGCGFVSHEKCLHSVVIPCQQNALDDLKIPSDHRLVRQKTNKRRFCNVCRNRLDDTHIMSCTVCFYYVHESCQTDVIHNCKVTSAYRPRTSKSTVSLMHHWREGNLPSNAKCFICQKSCSNNECLTGYQCLSCARTAHANCAREAKGSCDFGSLKNIILPPYAVQLSNFQLWKTKEGLSDDSLEQINGHVNNGSSKVNGKDETNVVRIYDGSRTNPSGWKNVRITKNTSASQVLEEALRQFRITEELDKYYLTKASTTTKGKMEPERRLENYERPLNFFKTEKPQLFLRHDSLEVKHGSIRIYAGNMNTRSTFVKVDVNIRTPAVKLVEKALVEFGMTKHLVDDFCLVEVQMNPALSERYVDDHECIWSYMMERRRTSISASLGTRYYLHPVVENETKTTLFVSNLPTNVTHDLYYKLISNLLGNVCPSISAVTSFPNYGCLYLTFDTMDNATKAYDYLLTGKVEDKSLDVKILPNLHQSTIDSAATPLLVFVNTKSGGGQGIKLMSKFRRFLNKHQVFDLFDGGPLLGLVTFRKLRSFKILVCGGDGTFGWVLSCVDVVKANVINCKSPPCALLPLGTGNDLARELSWGSGFSSAEDPLSILTMTDYAALDYLDRWGVVFDPAHDSNEMTDAALPSLFIMNNYLGIGIDAVVSLDFHEAREEAPDKFNSRLHNKGVYVRAGLKAVKNSSVTNLQDNIEIVVDGETLKLPYLEGVLVLNISSWSAGADAWGKDKDGRFSPPAHNDGLLEVVGLSGLVHIGKILGGLSAGIHLGQGCQINIKLKKEVPVHVDGEPWLQNPCDVMIRPTLQPAVMLQKCNQSKSKFHSIH